MRAPESAFPTSCKTPTTCLDFIHPMRSNFQQIVLYCLGLHTQSPELKEVDLEPSPKRGSDKISMLTRKKHPKESNSCCIAWTNIWIPVLRGDLEPGAKIGASRTRALASLYWLSQSLHLKQSPNQISHKSTKVDPIRSSHTWKKVWPNPQILCSSACQNNPSNAVW